MFIALENHGDDKIKAVLLQSEDEKDEFVDYAVVHLRAFILIRVKSLDSWKQENDIH